MKPIRRVGGYSDFKNTYRITVLVPNQINLTFRVLKNVPAVRCLVVVQKCNSYVRMSHKLSHSNRVEFVVVQIYTRFVDIIRPYILSQLEDCKTSWREGPRTGESWEDLGGSITQHWRRSPQHFFLSSIPQYPPNIP
jgi:hypothetical protein